MANLTVWEVGGYDSHLKSTTFVLAPSIEVVKQHFYIGGGGFIRERPDVEINTDMRVLSATQTQEQKAFRAELAARAMSSILSNTRILQGIVRDIPRKKRTDENCRKKIAFESIAMADALIAELNKDTSK